MNAVSAPILRNESNSEMILGRDMAVRGERKMIRRGVAEVAPFRAPLATPDAT